MVFIVAFLFAEAVVIKLWWLILAVVALFCVVAWTRRVFDRRGERAEAQRRRLAGLVARADEQHRLVMQGDERGVYGEYPPAAT